MGTIDLTPKHVHPPLVINRVIKEEERFREKKWDGSGMEEKVYIWVSFFIKKKIVCWTSFKYKPKHLIYQISSWLKKRKFAKVRNDHLCTCQKSFY